MLGGDAQRAGHYRLMTVSAATPNPLVVAVMVTHRPGPDFDEALEALANQSYAALSVLIVDAASPEPVVGRVGPILPEAFVRRLDRDPGYAAAANEVQSVVDGAAYYLFLHDDVALDPTAVEELVAEALASNAGVVGPKLVSWNDPTRLEAVGLTADRLGFVHSLVDAGELDQAQHDRVRDVVLVPGAAILVRSDLFEVLGGFDPAIHLVGEDLDLCWRARSVGARVIVAPQARARHRGQLGKRLEERAAASSGLVLRERDLPRVRDRNRLRTVLVTESRLGLLVLLPALVIGAGLQTLLLVVRGRVREARRPFSSLRWSVANASSIRARRRELARSRAVSASEARRLHASIGALVWADVRNRFGSTDRSAAPVDVTLALDSRGAGWKQAAAVMLALMAALLVIGGRHLVTRGVPAVGAFGAVPAASDLFGEWASGYLRAGMGDEGVAPVSYLLMGVASIASFGASALVRTLALLALVPVGWVGAWRISRATGSSRSQFAALLIYAGNPLAYNAYAAGDLETLIAYAVAPWLLGHLMASSRTAPTTSRDAPGLGVSALRMGLAVFVASAFSPSLLVLAGVIAVGAVAGGVMAGRLEGAGRMLAVATGGTAAAFVLHLPWMWTWFRGSWWRTLVGPERGPTSFGPADLLLFDTGPTGSQLLSGALILAASVGLLFGRRWRLDWAARSWGMALTGWALAGLAAHDVVPLPPPATMLVVAALGLATAGALSVVSFEADLPRYSFGWRQAVAAAAAGAVLVAMLPIAGASFNGRWGLPKSDFSKTMGFLETAAAEGGYRVAWVGHPDSLPLASWTIDPGLSFGVSRNGLPDARDHVIGPIDTRTALIRTALLRARDGQTDRLGRLLAPFGVRYIVVLRLNAPPFAGGRMIGEVPALTSSLAEQVDLARVSLDDSADVYENTRWTAIPAVVDATDETLAGLPLDPGFGAEVAGGTPVLVDPGRWPGEAITGSIPAGPLLLAEHPSDRWRLEVGGRRIGHREALGVGMAFDAPATSAATLRYETPALIYIVLGLQVGLVVVALIGARDLARFRRWA